jgi:hypothetical protein
MYNFLKLIFIGKPYHEHDFKLLGVTEWRTNTEHKYICSCGDVKSVYVAKLK